MFNHKPRISFFSFSPSNQSNARVSKDLLTCSAGTQLVGRQEMVSPHRADDRRGSLGIRLWSQGPVEVHGACTKGGSHTWGCRPGLTNGCNHGENLNKLGDNSNNYGHNSICNWKCRLQTLAVLQ
jgi:hypothetical protein